MADKTIPAEHVILLNHWPNARIPSMFGTPPLDGFTGADHHNVAAAKYQVGAMITVWNNATTTGFEGWSTLMYARNKTTAIAAVMEVCQPADAEAPYYISSTLANALIVNDICMIGAVSIGAMTVAYYGWFWAEGVNPGDVIDAMDDGDLPTSNDVIIGQACIGAGAGTKCTLEAQTAGELDAPFAFCLEVDAA